MRSDRGQILILTAVSMVALLGMAALALDASYMYDKRNRLYAAADAAAKSGAMEVQRSPSALPQATLDAFGAEAVRRHGFNPGGSTTVVMRTPPTSGAFAGSTGYVEATVSEPTSTFVGTILGWISMTPGARAVAGTSSGPNCLVTFQNLSVGVAHVVMPGCSIAAGGNMSVHNGNAGVVAASVGVTGTCAGSNCPGNVQTGALPPSDPLSGLTPPANPGGCTAATITGSGSLTAGCYSSITLSNNSQVNLGPGVYYLTGPLSTGNSPRICLNAGCTFDYGNGVMIYLVGSGQINVQNGALMRLNAQTSGPYNGILFYQDRSNSNPATFANGSATYDLSGAMYFPSADVEFGNGGGSNNCALFVARNLSLGNGQNNFSNTCSNYGGSPILTVSLAE